MAFDIGLAVREGDTVLRDELDRALRHRRAQIERALADFSVPVLERDRAP
jgi:hypothetical protein